MVAAVVACSASFCACWRSSAAILARCSVTWLSRSWRCVLISAGSASAGGVKLASGSSPPASAARSRAMLSCSASRSLRR